MTFFEIIDSLLFKPLQLLFEVIYVFANKFIANPGLSIIVLSLVMNFLVLPLYKRADAMQEEERDTEARLHKGVSHIKKTFRGDEKMMILQTYYRQNNYKPTYVLRGAISLFLEIPFFISAYRFLSGLELIRGVSFGPIADLGAPDRLIAIGAFHINLLPIIMTAVNLVSCVIFTKGAAPKTKIQLYSMAVFFLFFLYTSPSGLVFYWTLNNIFSLIKTIFYKLKNPGKVLGIIFSAVGAVLAVYGLFFYPAPSFINVKKLFVIFLGIAFQLPLAANLLKEKTDLFANKNTVPNKKVFFAGGVFMSLFTGLFIPITVIKSSAQEFVNIRNYQNPVWFAISSFCLAFGAFVIWLGIFYWLSSPAAKVWFEKAVWILSGVAVVDFMFFGKKLGLLSSTLTFENGVIFSRGEMLLNALAVIAAAAVMYLAFRFLNKHIFKALTVVILALLIMIPVDIVNINSQVKNIRQTAESNGEVPSYTLSKKGKNVIVMMLDRAMGVYLPYLFNEKPELKEQFSGFKYYSNVVSQGGCTNFGSPAILGGYEYVPENMNKRKDERLVDKHNEAVKLMPLIFRKNKFNVTVFDPVYANYQWNSDVSVFSDYPDIKAYVIDGLYESPSVYRNWRVSNLRNFFMYSLMKVSPAAAQKFIYNNGDYYRSDVKAESTTLVQTRENAHKGTGLNSPFISAYSVLENLQQITNSSDSDKNTFLFMVSNATHEPMLLKEPEYVPVETVDNTEYDKTHTDRFELNGFKLDMKNELQYMHYQINMATMMKLGSWFDYLKKIGVYDNTRIILVSDHGRGLCHNKAYILKDNTDLESFYPLLMVKDFGSEKFTSSDEFMTIADVPTLAMDGLIDNPVNPFTGNKINSDYKNNNPVYVFGSNKWDVNENNGNQFIPGPWYKVNKRNVKDKHNWKKAGENQIFPDGFAE